MATSAHFTVPPPRVFVFQRPRPNGEGWTPNLAEAAQHGQLVYIFDLNDRVFLDPERAFRKAQVMLADFRPGVDFLLYPNFCDPASAWLVIFYLAARLGAKFLQFLYWVKPRSDSPGSYVPMNFDLRSAPAPTGW